MKFKLVAGAIEVKLRVNGAEEVAFLVIGGC